MSDGVHEKYIGLKNVKEKKYGTKYWRLIDRNKWRKVQEEKENQSDEEANNNSAMLTTQQNYPWFQFRTLSTPCQRNQCTCISCQC